MVSSMSCDYPTAPSSACSDLGPSLQVYLLAVLRNLHRACDPRQQASPGFKLLVPPFDPHKVLFPSYASQDHQGLDR